MSDVSSPVTLLSAAAVSFAYGKKQVLHEINLELSAGEIVALLGPNGSGKSTLLRVLLGILCGNGDVKWDGRNVRRWKRNKLAQKVAYLPQNPAHEPGQSVAGVMQLGRAPYLGAFGMESAADARIVNETAERLDLLHQLDRPMDELSGGQRQRVFLGRCLVQQPKALLLDEPNTFLDLKHQTELGRLLKRLAGENGIAILMASHDLNFAGGLADRLVLLHDGTVAAAGTPDEVLTPEVLTPVYEIELRQMKDERGIAILPVG